MPRGLVREEGTGGFDGGQTEDTDANADTGTDTDTGEERTTAEVCVEEEDAQKEAEEQGGEEDCKDGLQTSANLSSALGGCVSCSTSSAVGAVGVTGAGADVLDEGKEEDDSGSADWPPPSECTVDG